MDDSQQQQWIQVIGQIAVHRPRRQPQIPTGATRLLLAVLTAAGVSGATIEQVADACWKGDRPRSWRVALRASTSHLNTQLPDGWEVCSHDGRMLLVPGDGFVDAWRLEQGNPTAQPPKAYPAWLEGGQPFAGISGIPLIDQATERLLRLMPPGKIPASEVCPFTAQLPLTEAPREALTVWIEGARRAIVTAGTERHGLISKLALADDTTQTHGVVGDRGLLLPLGSFAIAFPELRRVVRLEQGVVEPGVTAGAFRVVADTLAQHATRRPQRLVIANAHELDTKSLQLASLLIDRAPRSDFSMILCADRSHRDIRWLDFISRSVTAGCTLTQVDEASDSI